MPKPAQPPARLTNWHVEWFDRTAAGREAMARLVALLPLVHATVRRRLSAATPGTRVRAALGSSWPTELADLGLSVADARSHRLEADLAALVGATTAEVRAALRGAHGNTRVANALALLEITASRPPLPASSTSATATGPADQPAHAGMATQVWRAGEVVGGVWRLVGPPAVGGFGEAWPAVGADGQRVWVKRALPGREASLLREMRQLGKLRHPHIVELLAAGPGPNPWLVVADAGETLRARIAAGPLALAELWPWLDAIARALDYAHLQKVIHHDVNPGNMARDDAGVVRLLDFGTTADMVAGTDTIGGVTEVASAAVGFHPGFVATELLVAQRARKGTDQYSLAAVGLAALAGVADGRVQWTAPALPLGPAQRAVFAKALALSPRDRFATCGAFVGALRRAKG